MSKVSGRGGDCTDGERAAWRGPFHDLEVSTDSAAERVARVWREAHEALDTLAMAWGRLPRLCADAGYEAFDFADEARQVIAALLEETCRRRDSFDPVATGEATAFLAGILAELATDSGWSPTRVRIPQGVRNLILRRDGYRCMACGEDDRTLLQIDHRVPVALGGGNDPDNLRVLCAICNRRKGAAL